ncbi:c-type cytochrome [Thalassotalea psychrophila]|uniref:C-type cytochrome n=1 Tax=Thalassotalea psychrophila TaxID=3065647 RepID=A0ABY9TVC5_9GAMM|nr:c-type cytochrome [Colwelliaceae bacterium SQ149]
MTKVKWFSLLLCIFLLGACQHHEDENSDGEHVHGAGYADWINGPTSDPLSPADALKSFNIQKGLTIETFAAEPLVQDPVLISFDAKGRAWVAEMTNFMLDVAGTGQTNPEGNIVIVEDTDGDNIADKRTVFLNNIVLPRTIAHVKGGILFADNESLYFAPNVNDKAGKVVMVDPTFAQGGNVEHKTNGLVLGPDNWLYNAESDKRYRVYPLSQELPIHAKELYRNKYWKIALSKTDYRGQWGISTDDYGRLFYNRNSFPMMTDNYRPNIAARNKNFIIKEKIQSNVSGREVYPSRETPGINRAYYTGKLDENNTMMTADAASGPVIFRGTALQALYGQAIFPEPAGHLVSAIRLSDSDGQVTGKPFYHKTELLTSQDERFRPVNTHTAPDGSLFIVDMYRGIIQDRTYLTRYLSEYILNKKLDEGVHMGRIYRVRQQGSSLTPIRDLSELSSKALVETLNDENGFYRDTARRLLIERQDKSIITALEQLALSADKDYMQLGALWSLEGLDAISVNLLAQLIKDPSNKVKVHAIRHGEMLSSQAQQTLLTAIKRNGLLESHSYEIAAELIAALPLYQTQDSLPLLASLAAKWQKQPMTNAIALSGLEGKEQAFIASLTDIKTQEKMKTLFAKKPKKVKAMKTHLTGTDLDIYKRGMKIYKSKGACNGCHGTNGEGIAFAGPPLAESEWVTGSPERLAALLLNGLTGPVHVKGKLYDPGIAMPGIKDSFGVSLAEMTALMAYLRNSWGNKGSLLTITEVYKVDAQTKDRKGPYTEAELISEFD